MPIDFEPIEDTPGIDFEPITTEPEHPVSEYGADPLASARSRIREEVTAPENNLGRVYQPQRIPKWEDIKKELPADMMGYAEKMKNSLSLAATFDIAPSQAYDLHDIFTEKLQEPSLWDKAQGSFKAGFGDVYATMGNTMKWLGYSDEAADTYIDFGERLRAAYIPPTDTSEFSWRKVKDPEYWATTVTRSVPFTLSLVPAAIVGAYGGVAVAGAAGLGVFGTTVAGALGGAALSRPIESAFEAGGVYEEALAKGMTEEEADASANKTFIGNMALTGLDAAQFALAFTPLRIAGPSAKRMLALRILATGGKLAAVGLSEAGEERYQETISMGALGEDTSFFNLKDPRLNEASFIGGVFGVGLGGAGSVWTGLTNHVENTMPDDLKTEYEAKKGEAISQGKTDAQAQLQALDAIASTPEGKQHIEAAVETLKKAAENTARPVISEAIEEDAGEQVVADTPAEPDIADGPLYDAIFSLMEEGKDFESLTDEEITAKIETFMQGAVPALKGEGMAEGGVSTPGAVAGTVEGQTGVYEAVSSQLKAVGMSDEAVQSQAALWDSFFSTMGKRVGVDPMELFKRYNLQVEKEGKRGTVNSDGSLNLTGSERLTLELVRSEVEQGEAGQRVFVWDNESQGTGGEFAKITGEPSSFPEYFKNKGYTKKETITAIDKALEGKPLGVRQLRIVQDLNEGFRTQTVEELKRMRKEKANAGEDVSNLSDEDFAQRYFQSGPPLTETPEFKAWFGESKVVDSKGEPLVVYHGTASDVEAFDPKQTGKNFKKDKAGFFFSSSSENASGFARAAGNESENIIPAYLSILNPLQINAGSDDVTEFWFLNTSAYTNQAKEGKHDGIIVSNEDGEKMYVAFRPEQIKSVFNRGTFDPNDPRILFQKSRGKITFGPGGVNIELLKGADRSTFLHETGHFYLKVLGDLVTAKDAPKELRTDFKTILDWLGVKSVAQIETKHHEKWARGFEKYLMKGEAPSSKLRAAFERFKDWLTDVYKHLKALNVNLTPEVTEVMDRLLATREELSAREQVAGAEMESVLPTKGVKSAIEYATGVKRTMSLIREDKALAASWKKAEQSARIAFREGKKEESVKLKAEMQRIIAKVKEKAAEKIATIKTEKQKLAARRKQINDIVEFLGLTDAQVKKLVKKDIRLMTDYEYKTFKDNLLIRAEAMQEKAFEKARVREVIERKRLEKVENYRRVLGYPTIDGMSTGQLRDFADTLEEFQDGDVFLTERELETVDKTDLKGIKTWREAKEALAKELGVSLESLDTIKPTAFDMLRWDASLAERNSFYGLLVETTTKSLMNAEARYHEVENRIYELAKKSEKSRGRTLVERLIPQDKQIFEYLEATSGLKAVLAEKMTAEQVDLANYMAEYFGQALEHLIKTKALEKGRENYITHIRRSFLETLKEDGLGRAVLDIFKNYQQDEMVFNILDDDTGNILPLEKFFQFSMRRSGTLEPTQNVVKAFLTYAKTFEKKVSLDEIIPKLDIYTQSLTPREYTPRGLEMDRSLKKFVNRYINNKKGRQISYDSFIKQGGPIDLGIRALRTFTTMLDLGISIPVGVASFVGERVANFQLLGAKAFVLGEKRVHMAKGRAILKKYEHFIGRSIWEEFTAPGKEVTERLMTGLFGLFHQSSVAANEVFLLGAITESEYNIGEISDDRLTALKMEMGRWRVVPGTKSIVGSTSIGGAAIQYKAWAAVMARTTIKDMTTLISDLKNKPVGEALTTKEARELYRAIGLIAVVLMVSGAGDDERDKSFTGQLIRRIRNESLSILSAISPDMWLSTPRIVGFISQLGKNLTSLILLEEYKTKPGLKGVEGLKRQFTPGAVRQLTAGDEKKAGRR